MKEKKNRSVVNTIGDTSIGLKPTDPEWAKSKTCARRNLRPDLGWNYGEEEEEEEEEEERNIRMWIAFYRVHEA